MYKIIQDPLHDSMTVWHDTEIVVDARNFTVITSSIMFLIYKPHNTCWTPHLEMNPKGLMMATLVLFSASEGTHCTLVVCERMSDCSCTQRILNIPQFSFFMAVATWNCCCLGASSVYTIQPCTSLQCHFMQSCGATSCKAVVHFWIWFGMSQ